MTPATRRTEEGRRREGRREARTRRTKDEGRKDAKRKADEGAEAGRRSTSTGSPRASSACRSRPTTSTASPRRRGTCSTDQAARRFYGRDSDGKPALAIFDLKEREETTLVDDVDGYALSRDGTKVLVAASGEQATSSTTPSRRRRTRRSRLDEGPGRRPRAGRGVGDDLRRGLAPLPRLLLRRATCTATTGRRSATRYRALLPHVAHRSDLNYVLGEMVAELNVGHAYIEGGDFEMPGAAEGRPARARASSSTRRPGRYRIAHDLPRAERGGELPLAAHRGRRRRRASATTCSPIDGDGADGGRRPLPAAPRQDRPGHAHRSTRSPTLEGARKVTLRADRERGEPALPRLGRSATASGSTKLTGGRVGYLHIPDMGAAGIYEFIKWFYPQIRKEGLVVDVRSNGGGNVSQWIIERLDAEAARHPLRRRRATSRRPTPAPSSTATWSA